MELENVFMCIIASLFIGLFVGLLFNDLYSKGLSDDELYYKLEAELDWVINNYGDMKLSDFKVHAHNHKDYIISMIKRDRSLICNSTL